MYHLKKMVRIKVIAGTRLYMATAYVADVKAMLSIYKFCASVPLHYVITRFTSYS